VEFTAPDVENRIARTGTIAFDEDRFVAPLTKAAIKVTMPSASTLPLWRGTTFEAPGTYADARTFCKDLARVSRGELAEPHAAGGRDAPLDDVPLAMLCNPQVRAKLRSDGSDPEALVDLYGDAINDAVSDCPAGMRTGVHRCRGNFKGRYLSEWGYDSVAQKLFGCAKVDSFRLEHDTPRAGDFACPRHAPSDKGVVLGIVSSKRPESEAVDFLRERIDEAARHIDPAQLGVSPQCGFASTVAGIPVTEEHQWAKRARCVEVARTDWGD
jgi:5-methyltetrahydropteroyltriglutamate--homocysteine methyltransferase